MYSLGALRFIIDVIEHGYKLPFTALPPESVRLRSNKSAYCHTDFVFELLNDLQKSNRIMEVHVPLLVINPQSVSV